MDFSSSMSHKTNPLLLLNFSLFSFLWCLSLMIISSFSLAFPLPLFINFFLCVLKMLRKNYKKYDNCTTDLKKSILSIDILCNTTKRQCKFSAYELVYSLIQFQFYCPLEICFAHISHRWCNHIIRMVTFGGGNITECSYRGVWNDIEGRL